MWGGKANPVRWQNSYPRPERTVATRPPCWPSRGCHDEWWEQRDGSRMIRKMLIAITLCGELSAFGGCSNSSAPDSVPRLGLSCVDDSSHCISQREKAFDQLMADKSRSWVKQPATPEAYASGVRLFALNKKRKDLSCDELASGRREADAGPGILRSAGSSRLTPAQVARGAMLATEVSRDLGREYDKRCKRT